MSCFPIIQEINSGVEADGANFTAAWSRQDAKIIDHIYRVIQAEQDKAVQSLKVQAFLDILFRYMEDKTPLDGIEPEQIILTKNRVTNSGLTLFAALIAGGTTASVTHMAAGSNNSPTSPDMNALVAEVTRAPVSWSSAHGSIITWGATFGINVTSFEVSEVGLFTASSGGTMVARAVYPVGKTVTHTQGSNYITSNHVISQLSS